MFIGAGRGRVDDVRTGRSGGVGVGFFWCFDGSGSGDMGSWGCFFAWDVVVVVVVVFAAFEQGKYFKILC